MNGADHALRVAAEPASAALHGGFLRSARLFPQRPAVEVAGETLTYGELERRAASLAAVLAAEAPPTDAQALTGVFAYRSATAFSGVLAALSCGHGFVPLNRRFPADRTRVMLERSGLRSLIVDQASAAQLQAVLDSFEEELLILLPDHEDAAAVAAQLPRHRVLGPEAIAAATPHVSEPAVPDDALAYVLFTSGSTGTPKAVQVSQANVRHYVDFAIERWKVSELDRVSQTFDMTFDLSIHDMFVAWEAGACICCPPAHIVSKPGKFISDSHLTIWYAVPSVGLLMNRFGMLRAGAYPELRLVLFCGEPLPRELAEAWADAAPNAVIENLYGPTEATISCSVYRWDRARSPAECEHGVVPIGHMNPGMSAVVVGEELREVAPGEVGELLVAGPQVTLGYRNDPERTAAAFIRLEDEGPVHYRTGDRVRRTVDDRPLTYLGRVDHQVKISGHRVELGEIEAALRQVEGIEEAVAVGWPVTETGYAAVAAFVCGKGDGIDVEAARSLAAERLPDYMVPRRLVIVDEMPLNANGKVDRGALVASLGDQL